MKSRRWVEISDGFPIRAQWPPECCKQRGLDRL